MLTDFEELILILKGTHNTKCVTVRCVVVSINSVHEEKYFRPTLSGAYLKTYSIFLLFQLSSGAAIKIHSTVQGIVSLLLITYNLL